MSQSETDELVAVDFETYYDADYSLTTMSTWNYIHDARFDAYLVAIFGNGIKFTGHPSKLDWHILDGKTVVMHNASFDEMVFERLKETGVVPADVTPKQVLCTADLVAYLGCKRDLKTATKELLGEEADKTVRANMKGKHYADAVAAGMEDELLQYGCDDAIHCFKLAEKYLSQWPENERTLSTLNRKAGAKGIFIDVPLVDAGIRTLKTKVEETTSTLPWVEEGLKPLSSHAIRAQGRADGIPVPASLAKDDPLVLVWQEKYGAQFPWVKATGEYRSINTLLKRVESVKQGTREDLSMPYQCKYFGAQCVTGEHEVLTPTGWVAIKDWTGGEIVQWDPDTRGTLFAEATANKFMLEQPLYEINAPYVKLVVTAGHTMPCFSRDGTKFNPVTADVVVNRQLSIVPVAGVRPVDVSVEGRILAMVQADGHWVSVEDGGMLQITVVKKRKKQRCEQLLTEAGIVFSKHVFPSRPESTRYQVRKADCPTWLTRERKVLGVWCLSLPTAWQAGIVEEVSYWDGWRGNFGNEYYSANKISIDTVQTLMHMFGYKTSRTVRLSRVNTPNYRLFISKRGPTSWIMQKHCSVSAEKPEHVYCPTTKTGFWLVRFRGCISVTGNTGRFSGGSGDSGGKLNVQNMPRHEMFGVDLRHMFHARPGKVFIMADFCQIEARILLWKVGDKEFIERLKEDGNIYIAAARRMWGKSIAKGTPDYQLAKASTLLLGFQGGWERFQLTASKPPYNLILSNEEAQNTVTQYREANPRVVQHWRQHQQWLQFSVNHGDDTHEVELPSGRIIRYFNPRSECVYNEKLGRDCIEYTALGERGGIRSRLHSGVITNNEIQGTARDVLRDSWIALDKAGYSVLWSVHDEVIVEVDKDKAKDAAVEIVEIMRSSSPWAAGCPLDAEAVISEYYCK